MTGGLALVFALFHWTAAAWGSVRGERGLAVCAVVLASLLLVERFAFGQEAFAAMRQLGLGRPRPRGLAAATALCVCLLSTVPVFMLATDASFTTYRGWPWLVPGLFAQAGIAEETLFRGFLFRRLRVGRSFWRAAWLSMPPFVGVHLLMFLTMPWPVALVAVLLACVVSFPLAWLYELGGQTVWAAALAHFVIQATVKVIVVGDEGATLFAVVWMAVTAAGSMLVFLVRPANAVAPQQIS